jgi:hypothetical protein
MRHMHGLTGQLPLAAWTVTLSPQSLVVAGVLAFLIGLLALTFLRPDWFA